MAAEAENLQVVPRNQRNQRILSDSIPFFLMFKKHLDFSMFFLIGKRLTDCQVLCQVQGLPVLGHASSISPQAGVTQKEVLDTRTPKGPLGVLVLVLVAFSLLSWKLIHDRKQILHFLPLGLWEHAETIAASYSITPFHTFRW